MQLNPSSSSPADGPVLFLRLSPQASILGGNRNEVFEWAQSLQAVLRLTLLKPGAVSLLEEYTGSTASW